MNKDMRRVVTGHDTSGRAVVKRDERLALAPRLIPKWEGAEVWATATMPVNNDDPDPQMDAGSVAG